MSKKQESIQEQAREKRRTRALECPQLRGVIRKPSPVDEHEAGYPARVMAHLILVHEWTVDGITTINVLVKDKGVNALEVKGDNPLHFLSEMASCPGVDFDSAKKNLLEMCLKRWPEFFQLWIDGGL